VYGDTQIPWYVSNRSPTVTVTPAKYAAIHTGQTMAQVEAIAGRGPDITLTQPGAATSKPVVDCIYYSDSSGASADEFCFDHGRLSSKSNR